MLVYVFGNSILNLCVLCYLVVSLLFFFLCIDWLFTVLCFFFFCVSLIESLDIDRLLPSYKVHLSKLLISWMRISIFDEANYLKYIFKEKKTKKLSSTQTNQAAPSATWEKKLLQILYWFQSIFFKKKKEKSKNTI